MDDIEKTEENLQEEAQQAPMDPELLRMLMQSGIRRGKLRLTKKRIPKAKRIHKRKIQKQARKANRG